MIEAIGGLVGGLGLFLVGVWLLSENLKTLTTRRLRLIAVRWIPNRYAAWGWGILAGGVIQSTSALTFITVGLMRANLIATDRAFALLLGGSLAAGIMVLLVSLNIHLAALYVLGVASFLVVNEKAVKFRHIGAMMVGAALIFVGLGLIKESGEALAGQPLFDDLLGFSGGSLWLSFLVAAAVCFVAQSSLAVMVLAVGLGASGILTDDQVLMAIYGSWLGANIIMLPLSLNLTGTLRSIAMFQFLYNILMITVFVLLLYIELWSGVPLVKALLLSLPLEHPMAAACALADLLGSITMLFLLPGVARLFSRLWPATAAESMSRAEYIYNRPSEGVSTALTLIAMEQRRVLSALSSYLDAVRQGNGIDSLRDGVRSLIREIDEFLTEVRHRHPGHAIEEVNSILAQQRLVVWLEELFAELCDELNQLPDNDTANQLRDVMIDGIDTLTLVIIDGLANQEPEHWEMAVMMTGNRDELLSGIRSGYAESEFPPGDEDLLSILSVTNTAGEIFYLFSRLAQEMRDSPVSAAPEPALPRL